jgi:hypothetical protein
VAVNDGGKFLDESCLPAPAHAHLFEWIKVLDEEDVSPPKVLAVFLDVFDVRELRCVIHEDRQRCCKKHQLEEL